MERSRLHHAVAVLGAAILLAACSGPAPSTGDGMKVVATTTVLGDLAANVAGDRATVHSIVPPGGEVHTFDPSPSDLTEVARASLILTNGLGLDDWLAILAADAGSDATVIPLAENLDGVSYRSGAEAGGFDPHVWMNVAYAEKYVTRIRDELTSLDPAGADTYRANADAYLAQLQALDAEMRSTFASVPAANRKLVSYHDGFGYFADAYGLEIVGTVTSSPGQDPSAGEVAALIDEIRASGVHAILAEAQFPTSLAERIADETGIPVVRDLYDGSVGPAPHDTYITMLRWDAQQIADALR